jgi:hypothetical protein
MAVVEVDPERCPNWHEFGPNLVTRGWLPCDCTEGATGHRTWFCWSCRVTTYAPPRAP